VVGENAHADKAGALPPLHLGSSYYYYHGGQAHVVAVRSRSRFVRMALVGLVKRKDIGSGDTEENNGDDGTNSAWFSVCPSSRSGRGAEDRPTARQAAVSSVGRSGL